MNTLYRAYQTNQGRTWNGAKTQVTSFNKCVDLFFNIGSMRGKDPIPMFTDALVEDEDKALRILQWLRDVREGAGERRLFREMLLMLESVNHRRLPRIITKTPVLGRWDDLLIFQKEENKKQAYSMIKYNLEKENGLCAKWMPRKGPIAVELTKYLKLSPRAYRKMLVRLSNTVETLMCANDWDEIEFDKIPSLASARYQKAFGRNCSYYDNYIKALQKGKTKINAAAVYPYDITKSMEHGKDTVANEQWKALPNYLEGSKEKILPVVDVSGSMYSHVGGRTVRAIDVAVSLGLYLSERLEGDFKDVFMTFSEVPEMYKLEGTLKQRYTQLSKATWGYNTNIQKTFEALLGTAVECEVLPEEMPTMILILSDMEFDEYNVRGKSVAAFKGVKKLYEENGYEMPKLVFWNLNGRRGNVPVSHDETGTALVSGFSPSIMKSVLKAKNFTPEEIMNETIMKDRYNLWNLSSRV